MSNKGFINNALARPLQPGRNYTNLLPSSTCESTYLGKGDTFFSMDGIKANILKNYSQCAKLAPQLQKKSLAETVTAIYDFLYNHIQYKADGSDQNLRSPACSWSVRQSGIDCKSYSIFSGCILTVLGIKYYIRKIKQPGMLPKQYTHVYVIVPKDQKTGSLSNGYFTLDATKHENTEAAFLQKNDVFMEKLSHFGLQAPNPGFCNNSPSTMNEAKQGFEEFLTILKRIGVEHRIICKIRNLVNEYLSKGIDPNFAIAPQGVVIEKTLIPFHLPSGGPRMYKSPVAVINEFTDEKGGLNGLYGEGGGSGEGGTTTAGGEEKWYSEMGEELFKAVKTEIMGSSWWDRTFKEFFGNNWKNWCINTSNSPRISGLQVETDTKTYFDWSGLGNASKGGLTTENLQKFVDVMSAYIAHRNFGQNNGDLAKCTRAGNKVGFEGATEALYQVTAMARTVLRDNGGDLKANGTKVMKTYNFGPTASGYLNSTGGIHDDARFVTESQSYTVIKPKKPVTIPPPTTGTGSGTTTGGGGTTTGGGGTTTGGGGTTTGGGGTTTGGGGTTKPPVTTSPVKKTNPNNPWNYLPAAKPQKAGMNSIIVLGLVGGAIYLAYKQREKK
jgi:hypothetical protein